MPIKKQLFTKNNKVLFVIHDLYQDDNMLPAGPAYLAAVLNEAGAKTEAYCMDIFHYTNEELEKHSRDNSYDIIGLGFSAARFSETVVDLCKVIDANKKNAWFVLGGHGPSPIPEYMLRTTKADVVAIGEAENTIIDLLQCKINQGDLSKVDGIAYLKDGELKITKPNRIIYNLDSLPLPLWEIFPMEKYINSLQLLNQRPDEISFCLNANRGCVNRCNFCYRMEKGIRVRSIGNIMNELKILNERWGVNYFSFIDELFVISKKRLLEFEQGLMQAGLKIKFYCNARVDILDEEMVEILKRSGCQFINFGFESSDNNVLKLMNKNVTVEQNIRALEIVKKVGGIGMGLNFLWNNLGDTEASLMRNVELIKQYNTYYQCRTIRPAIPFPGTDLYYYLIKAGKLKGPEDFFNKFKNSDLLFINLMDIPDKRAYELLLEVNTDLIMDHYTHVKGDMNEAKFLIQQLSDLYSGKITNFRGVRHYKKENKEN